MQSTNEKEGYLPFSAISLKGSTVLSVLNAMAPYNIVQEVKDMFVFDAVILNENRHKGNFDSNRWTCWGR